MHPSHDALEVAHPTGRAQTRLTDDQRTWTTPQLFDLFWTAYPRKEGKKKARMAWAKLNPSVDVVERMLSALAWQRRTPQWLRDGGEFIPHPTTYLHGERWEDEPRTREVAMLSGRAAQTLAASHAFLEIVSRNATGGVNGTDRRTPLSETDGEP